MTEDEEKSEGSEGKHVYETDINENKKTPTIDESVEDGKEEDRTKIMMKIVNLYRVV